MKVAGEGGDGRQGLASGAVGFRASHPGEEATSSWPDSLRRDGRWSWAGAKQIDSGWGELLRRRGGATSCLAAALRKRESGGLAEEGERRRPEGRWRIRCRLWRGDESGGGGVGRWLLPLVGRGGGASARDLEGGGDGRERSGFFWARWHFGRNLPWEKGREEARKTGLEQFLVAAPFTHDLRWASPGNPWKVFPFF